MTRQVYNEDYESVESDESVEVQPRASKRPRRTVMQKTQQPGSQTAQFVRGQGAVDTFSIVHSFNTFGLQGTGSETYSWLTLLQTVD